MSANWQPIDTAPKDGSFVDLWCRQIPPGPHGDDGGVRYPSMFWSPIRGGWTGSYIEIEEGWQPTNWKPFPSPPTQGGR